MELIHTLKNFSRGMSVMIEPRKPEAIRFTVISRKPIQPAGSNYLIDYDAASEALYEASDRIFSNLQAEIRSTLSETQLESLSCSNLRVLVSNHAQNSLRNDVSNTALVGYISGLKGTNDIWSQITDILKGLEVPEERIKQLSNALQESVADVQETHKTINPKDARNGENHHAPAVKKENFFERLKPEKMICPWLAREKLTTATEAIYSEVVKALPTASPESSPDLAKLFSFHTALHDYADRRLNQIVFDGAKIAMNRYGIHTETHKKALSANLTSNLNATDAQVEDLFSKFELALKEVVEASKSSDPNGPDGHPHIDFRDPTRDLNKDTKELPQLPGNNGSGAGYGGRS